MGEFSVHRSPGKSAVRRRPTFRWSPSDGATDYVVEVYDEGFNLVATSAKLILLLTRADGTATAQARLYLSWQVKATKDGTNSALRGRLRRRRDSAFSIRRKRMSSSRRGAPCFVASDSGFALRPVRAAG